MQIQTHLNTNTKTFIFKYKKGIQIETQKKIICWNLVLAKATIVNMSTLMKFP